MPKGLITSLLIKLTVDFWYLTLLALLIKLFLIRFTVTGSFPKALLIWISGSVVFYVIACFAGIIFSSTGFYYIPFIMFTLAVFAEFSIISVAFKVHYKRLIPAVMIGNGLFFMLLFMQML